MIAPPELDPWDTTLGAGTANPETVAAIWRERERRQRTIRLLMMFLVMLLLMDGEEGAERRQHNIALHKRQKKKNRSNSTIDVAVFHSRQIQEQRIRSLVVNHPRFEALVKRNGGENIDESVQRWAEQQAEQEKDQFAENASQIRRSEQPLQEVDPEADNKVYHYPWNSTGFYRGDWSRIKAAVSEGENVTSTNKSIALSANEKAVATEYNVELLEANALEQPVLRLLQNKQELFGVVILPNGLAIEMRDDNNLTSMKWEELRTDNGNSIIRAIREETTDSSVSSDTNAASNDSSVIPTITLTHDSGRAAFQLFSRSVPAMKELSIVEGFVKLYDSTSPGYSTRKDILLRVRGVLIHAIGRLSLVSNVDISRSAFVIGDKTDTTDVKARRRRLMEALKDLDHGSNVDHIRDEAVALFPATDGNEEYRWKTINPGMGEERLDDIGIENETATDETASLSQKERKLSQQERSLETTEIPSRDGEKISTLKTDEGAVKRMPAWSDIVIPFPYVRDDEKETVRRTKTPAARMMPLRERALEANAAGCGFEINMDVGEEEWTLGAWRKLVGRKVNDLKRLDPSNPHEDSENEEAVILHLRGARPKPIQDQALVMKMIGTIHSPNCDFTAILNATALRTDWDATTSRAINYSFVMMLVCLTQILILLRQLLHSQGQSAASRVSLLCIGWQALIDALLCLEHIYLSLSIQQLFSAFASVSFFKLLIFCVIEMKYMAIIIQARNASNGGRQTSEQLRRQIALLHLRFYCAMAGCFLLFIHISDKYRIFFMLGLYSFWVPQIIMNISTEAKTPMHSYYIYGMSLTRLVAPFYLFGIRNNFLREVYPESPYDPFMCQMLALWVAIQTAVLIGQGKYGARFLIPARFLPPKFDYSRPIPASMLPPGVVVDVSQETIDDREDALHASVNGEQSQVVSSETSPPSRGRHTTAVTTRSRWKNRTNRNECSNMMITEAHSKSVVKASSPSASSVHHGLECSICYEGVDVRKRSDYMLAPCNHIFHRECLVQWMDVKMECPICRTELPAL